MTSTLGDATAEAGFDETGITGLRWEPVHSVPNGGESRVIPIPTTHLVHLVFHGEKPFSHGQFGFHTGLNDRLLFLGPPEQRATGYFLDCREDSPTLHRRVTFEFSPSTQRILNIPCGVAHCFDGLEGVYTLNTFNAFLPPPDVLLTDRSPWATGADIYNFAMDTPDSELPVVRPNPYPASETFYELLREMQAETLGSVDHEYPVTEDVTLPDGTTSTLMIRKRLSAAQSLPEWEPIPGIAGLGWKKHLVVWSGEEAGYSAFTEPSPLQVIEHGLAPYSTDAYGIHLDWEDRLTFVGPMTQKAVIRFIDCRSDSDTFHAEVVHEFNPTPLRQLIVPAGVAHAFEHLENIFTVNRPRRSAGDPDNFEAGNDVIDWPLADRPAPSFEIEPIKDVPLSYYTALASMQREFLNSPASDQASTASVILVDDGDGNKVRVALRSVQQVMKRPNGRVSIDPDEGAEDSARR